MRRASGLLTLLIFSLGPVAARAASQQIYDDNANPQQQIAAAIATASKSGQNILLIFGANWCPDCRALDAAMHQPDMAELIDKNYVVVHISVGYGHKNIEVGAKYGVPLQRGFPAIAVLDAHGNVLFAQDQGQFANARRMPYQDFKAFFEKWKPKS